MSSENAIVRLKKAIMDGQEEEAETTAREILAAGMDPLEVMDKELLPTMRSIGDKFENGEYFVADLMSSAEAMRAASHVLSSRMAENKKTAAKLGKIVIGTVSGDIHDIGKNIVSLLMEVNGFEVHDLGRSIESMSFVERGVELEPDIIALSALMTTTRPAQKEVIDLLKEMKLREKYTVMVGGAPTTSEWATQIGADGWAETAEQAVRVASDLIGGR